MCLGTGALQVGKGPEHFRHSKEVCMATLQAGTTPACNPPLGFVTLKRFSGEILTLPYTPES